MKIVIQRTWASLIGVASSTIGILKFGSIVHIPTLDAVVHIITGVIFIAGAWINKGQYVGRTNRWRYCLHRLRSDWHKLGPHHHWYCFHINWLINIESRCGLTAAAG